MMVFNAVALAVALAGPNKYQAAAKQIGDKGLVELGAYSMLIELCTSVGNRIAGSENAAKAVQWGQATMQRLGFQYVHLVPCMVPHWVRGPVEQCEIIDGASLTCCALGTSAGTSAEGVTGEVIEVTSIKEAQALGERARGKIIFFSRPFDFRLVSTFAQYGTGADQRFAGPGTVAKLGAIACLVRSMTPDKDDVPHTGTTRFDGAPIPAAALSYMAADKLHLALQRGPVKVHLTLSCKTLPDEPSASVVGELTGTEKPHEVIVMGGHLDSWDKGQGAHDDGAGVAQSLEALRLLKELGWRPKRTIRVVLFMNEEISGTGAEAYAAWAKTAPEKAYAGLESDSGGFAPREFSCSLNARRAKRLDRWLPGLSYFEADRFRAGGGGGADVGPLGNLGAVLFGLEPESQRYFDYHHSDKDTIDKVNPRELELGACSMALLVWLISEEGI